ncbi:MAG: hypothetical protein IJY39_03045 [Clostridia bacterium]|nr:hypothetical protein [Clostridia bacterium]
MSTIIQYVPVALLAIVALILVINIVKALIRGLKKTVGTLIAIVFSAIVAAIITFIVCKPTSSLMVTLMEWLQNVLPEGQIKDLFDVNELGVAASYYSAMLIAPIFFTLVYAVLSIVVAIIVAIVIKFVPPFKKPGAVLNRLGGMGVGVVCGVLVAVILLTPVVGMIGAISNLDEEQLASLTGDEAVAETITDTVNGPVVNTLTVMGCGMLYDLFASAEFEGDKVYLREDLAVIIGMTDDLQTLQGDVADYDDTQINALKSIISEMDKSPLLKNTVAGMLATASQKWLAGEDFIGIAKFTAGDLVDPVIDGLLEVMSTTDKNTVAADLGTMIDVFAIIIDSGILKEGGDYQSVLTKLGGGVISDLLVAINQNERMHPLSDEIMTLSVRALASTIGIPESADEQYDMLMNDIAGILDSTAGMSEEERASAVQSELSVALDEYGVDISDESVQNVTESVLADLGDLDSVTASDVEEFFIVYAIATTEETVQANGNGYSFDFLSDSTTPSVEIGEDGTVTVDGRVLENYSAEDYLDSAAYTSGSDGVDFGGAGTLSSADNMESSIVTLDALIDTLGSFSEVEDIVAEAEKIGNMISEASDVLVDVDFDNAAPEEILEKMGGLLDKMKETQIFGENSTESVLTAVLQNDAVTSSLGITGGQAANIASKLSEVANKSETGYTDVTVAVSTTITAINVSKDPNKSAEEKKQASENLINVMNADNADVLGTLLNSGVVSKQGASEEKADNVSLAMDLLLRNLAEYKAGNPDAEDVAREAEAVNSVLTLAMNGANANGKSMFSTEESVGVVEMTPDAFIHTLVSSTSIMKTVEDLVYDKALGDNPLGISNLDPAEEEVVAEALQNYYSNNGGGAELERKLEAIAAVINVKVDVK